MACDYEAIRRDNERRYGTDIGRIGPMLLANRYADRTHFIFEVLQNAEDALSRRSGWQGSRAVAFHLSGGVLRMSHFGKPFDEKDVRGICGIAESTKNLTEIGRFGIGFKSVYAFTSRPEVHSGAEDFAVDDFVHPAAARPVERTDDETIIMLPLKGAADGQEITQGFQQLAPRTLLFLREIAEIGWEVEGGPSGRYVRATPEALGEGVRRIAVVGNEQGKPEIRETWLVFSREVKAGQVRAGYAEIAFLTTTVAKTARYSLTPISESPLVAFFPTILPTNLGFLVQGPYRTTPSRDNVPRGEGWNQHLVQETAALLAEALRWLRDNRLLDISAFRCLPIDRDKFGETSMFAPLFEGTRQALHTERLLPSSDEGHVEAVKARLARTKELRELLSPSQLGVLFGHAGDLVWLSDDITADREPQLRQFLIQELGVAEITPDMIVSMLSRPFLEAQANGWVLRLYEFLGGQQALLRLGRFNDVPLIRLRDGKHVTPFAQGQPQAFLPSDVETRFPTVHPEVCATPAALTFLQGLGLTAPDAVDDIVRNVLPRYQAKEVTVSDSEYEADVKQILTAFNTTDSKSQRDRLLTALGDAAFVMAVDAGAGSKRLSKPMNVYLPTDRLKTLFAGVAGVLLADETHDCLRGEEVRQLLEGCGASRYLRPAQVQPGLTWEERRELRRAAGHEHTSRQKDRLQDWSLVDLDKLLGTFRTLNAESAAQKARVLWEALGDVAVNRGQSWFAGTYSWSHYGSYSSEYPSSFVRQLNGTAWIPVENSRLEVPKNVSFESLGWRSDPFLESKIQFKPPVMEQLAKEAGIEVGVLDLLKRLGVTSEAELRNRLGIVDAPEPASASPPPALEGRDVSTGGEHRLPEGDEVGVDAHLFGTRSAGDRGRGPGGTQGRPFISYIAALPDDEDPDPDGLDSAARLVLENKAISLILQREPGLLRTPEHNPGFDLLERDTTGEVTRVIEVKAMAGGLEDRPVGLSQEQFKYAQRYGADYWLYVVERAGDSAARLVRIQDPAGKARTFTFDHGWRNVAAADDEQEHLNDTRR